MGTQKRLDEPPPPEPLHENRFKQRDEKVAAALADIARKLNVNMDDVQQKIKYMSIVEDVSEITATKRYEELAAEGRDPYPDVRARQRR